MKVNILTSDLAPCALGSHWKLDQCLSKLHCSRAKSASPERERTTVTCWGPATIATSPLPVTLQRTHATTVRPQTGISGSTELRYFQIRMDIQDVPDTCNPTAQTKTINRTK